MSHTVRPSTIITQNLGYPSLRDSIRGKTGHKLDIDIGLLKRDWHQSVGPQHLQAIKEIIMRDDRLQNLVGAVYDSGTAKFIELIVEDKMNWLVMMNLLTKINETWTFNLFKAAEYLPEIKDSWEKVTVEKSLSDPPYCFRGFDSGVILGYGWREVGPAEADESMCYLDKAWFVNVVAIDESAWS